MKLKYYLMTAWLCGWAQAAPAEAFRTDINPALLYWQAFAAIPDLSAEDQKYLFENEWRNKPMDERAGQLALRFDSSFTLLRRAASSKVPCDWGVDLSDGPRTLLPHLAKAKRCAQAATLRARWFVQQKRPDAAQGDLLAAFVLGRNLARDQVLISALVQIAMESIISGYVVQQWPALDKETIGALLSGFEQAPARGTIAACMGTEKSSFYGWLVRQIEDLQARNPGDEQNALAQAAQLLTESASEEGKSRTGYGDEVIAEAGNSVAGLLRYVREVEPFYVELERAARMPYAEFQMAVAGLQQRVDAHPNLLLHLFFPALLKVRMREFRITARLAMVQAAYQYRLDPANGLKKVQDPFGSGPFEISRFVLDGTDRGFKLKSQLKVPDFDEVLIFAERTGPAFYIDGPNAGQKVP